MKPPSKPPTNPPTKPPTGPPTDPPTKPPSKPPTNPPTKPPTDPPTKPPTKPPTSDILSKLYDETNGDAWSNKTGWKDVNTPVCNWHGVNCSIYDEAIDLDLLNNQLYGTIPTGLGFLTNL